MADYDKDTGGDLSSQNDRTQIENSLPDEASPKETEGFVDAVEVHEDEPPGANHDFSNEAGEEKNDGEQGAKDAFVNRAEGQEDNDGMVEEENTGAEEAAKKGEEKKEAKSITRIRYSNDFKVKVLDELEVTNYTVAEMARRHKLPEATLRDWSRPKTRLPPRK